MPRSKGMSVSFEKALKLRIKTGALAMVTNGPIPLNMGIIVRIERPSGREDDCWLCETLGRPIVGVTSKGRTFMSRWAYISEQYMMVLSPS